jgi:3-deoxy-manno-octulosonate cytidylyltransferase (CMP-KDO synthetase)
VYAYRRRFLARLAAEPPCDTELAEKLEQLRALHMGARVLVLRGEEQGIGVDTPEHVKYVETILRERAAGGRRGPSAEGTWAGSSKRAE